MTEKNGRTLRQDIVAGSLGDVDATIYGIRSAISEAQDEIWELVKSDGHRMAAMIAGNGETWQSHWSEVCRLASFSQLHDICDANILGGMGEDERPGSPEAAHCGKGAVDSEDAYCGLQCRNHQLGQVACRRCC